MTTQTQRWFIRQEEPKHEPLQVALSWLYQQMSASPTHQGLLVVPQKKTLKDIEYELGTRVVKQLEDNNRARLQSGTLELMTQRIDSSSWTGIGPVLVLYPSRRLLDKVDEFLTSSEILVIPWSMDDVARWVQQWDARELGDTTPRPAQTFSNPTVRAALESLTKRINLSSGLSHPSDAAAATDMFQELHAAGEAFDPDEVRKWLISPLGWRPHQADKAAEIGQKVLSGKSKGSNLFGMGSPSSISVAGGRGTARERVLRLLYSAESSWQA